MHLRFKRAIDRCVKKGDRPFPHPRSSARLSGSKERSPGASKRAIARSPIRVHQPESAVQKCDRPVRQKERSPFPPSASISLHLRFKSAIALTPIRVHQPASAVQKFDRPFVKKSDRHFLHPHPSACISGSKVRSTFPHPRPSACICGSKVRSALFPFPAFMKFPLSINQSSVQPNSLSE